MSLDGVFLNCQVAEILSEIRVSVGLVLNIFSAGVEAILLLLDVNIVRSNLSSKVDVSSLGGLNMLANVVAIGGDSVDILSKSGDLNNLLGVKVLNSGNFSLGIIELGRLGSDVVGSSLDDLLSL